MAEAGLIAFTVILILVLILLLYFLARHFGVKRIISKLFGYESSSSDEERSILSKYEQLQNESNEVRNFTKCFNLAIFLIKTLDNSK